MHFEYLFAADVLAEHIDATTSDGAKHFYFQRRTNPVLISIVIGLWIVINYYHLMETTRWYFEHWAEDQNRNQIQNNPSKPSDSVRAPAQACIA